MRATRPAYSFCLLIYYSSLFLGLLYAITSGQDCWNAREGSRVSLGSQLSGRKGLYELKADFRVNVNHRLAKTFGSFVGHCSRSVQWMLCLMDCCLRPQYRLLAGLRVYVGYAITLSDLSVYSSLCRAPF